MANRKYEYNQHIFDVIDSPNKAYWLGFLWGDGGIVVRKPRHEYCLKIGLSSNDNNHLHKFKEFISATHPIKTYNIISKLCDGDFKESRISLHGKYLINVLDNKYGIVKNRISFKKLQNNIPKSYYRDLIRGLIDSDGWITSRDVYFQKSTRKEYSLGLIASESCLDFFNNYLIDNNLTETKYIKYKRHKDRDGDMLNIKITGNVIVSNILYNLYYSSETYLDRKDNLAKECIIYMNRFAKEKGYIKLKGGKIKYLNTDNDLFKIQGA